jgi:DNA-binding beta-propeller fold protein YncE
VLAGSLAAPLLAGCAGPPVTESGATPPGPQAGATGGDGSGGAAPAPRPAGTAPAPAGGRLLGYAFNAGSQDVTLFDAGTRRALETRPLGATVRWLSNEQRFWDGRYIWTYDHPEDRVQVLAIDPHAVRVARTIDTARRGPAHSLMLTPDGGTAWVNAAGADLLVAVDLASGAVTGEVKTGAFP